MRSVLILVVLATALACVAGASIAPGCLNACNSGMVTCLSGCPVACPTDPACMSQCYTGCVSSEQQCVINCNTNKETVQTASAEPLASSRAAPLKLSVVSEEEYRTEFISFVKKFNKKYTSDEFFPRYTIFKANFNKIRAHMFEHAQGRHTYTMALNEFADMSFEEFHTKMTGFNNVDRAVWRNANAENPDAPHKKIKAPMDGVDWRQQGAVTPVKNQQQCGSCWSFSATGATEGAHAISTGSLVSLSEQQLIDCSGSFGNNGCNGGVMDDAFQYIISNGGITTEDAYPYQAAQGTCQSGLSVAATLSSFQDVTSGDENALQSAVNIGPVSVAIEADQQCFQFYSGGVLSDPSCGTNLDHGVLVVGYGTDPSAGPYWIVKNSWGATWGESGYIRLAQGINECGIATTPSYPIV